MHRPGGKKKKPVCPSPPVNPTRYTHITSPLSALISLPCCLPASVSHFISGVRLIKGQTSKRCGGLRRAVLHGALISRAGDPAGLQWCDMHSTLKSCAGSSSAFNFETCKGEDVSLLPLSLWYASANIGKKSNLGLIM